LPSQGCCKLDDDEVLAGLSKGSFWAWIEELGIGADFDSSLATGLDAAVD
jgi:hypothetical protein